MFKKSKVLFYQSKQQDLETILWTIRNHKWLKQFCNEIFYPKLPQQLWQLILNDDVAFKTSREKVKRYLEKTDQLILEKRLKRTFVPLWRRIEQKFFIKIKKEIGLIPSTNYICYCVKYGGGGSFKLPNILWVRTNIQNKEDIKYFAYTVAHELVHLLVEKTCKGISQEKKEDKVNKILNKVGLFNKKTRFC